MKQITLTTLMLLGFIAASNSQNLPSYLPANGLLAGGRLMEMQMMKAGMGMMGR